MFIDYDSYQEFCTLLDEIIAKYKTIAIDLASNSILVHWPQKKDTLMRNVVMDSTDLWYKFTKGQQIQWCNSQCNVLAFMLVNTKILYENITEKHDYDYPLDSILHSMVVSYFEACPQMYFPDRYTNFFIFELCVYISKC